MRNTIFTLMLTAFFGAILVLSACKKNKNNELDVNALQKNILVNTADHVITKSYQDMHAKALALQTAIDSLKNNPNTANLVECQVKWREIRSTWEQTEAWLFGPVATDNIDPRIDTWPVDFNALEGILGGSDDLNEAYVDDLEDEQKGFHPIEYLLWGQNGEKVAEDFTGREFDFLTGLTANLVKLSEEVKASWEDSYATKLKTAGEGSLEYSSKKSAFVEIVDGMSGICEEVGEAKIKEPFDAQDPSLEESPFSKNSLTDFNNNINGILLIYQGKFSADGLGLEDLVRTYDLSLDTRIKAKHASAIAALNEITLPFGDAIAQESSKVENAINKIAELAETLDEELKPFVQKYAN